MRSARVGSRGVPDPFKPARGALRIKRGGALERGAAKIEVDGIAVFHVGTKVLVDVKLRNDGKQDARKIFLSGKTEFGESAQEVSFGSFTDFNLTGPDHLPKKGQIPVFVTLNKYIETQKTEGRNLYIWGAIKYTDFRGVEIPDTFCRYIPTTVALNTEEGIAGKGAYFFNPGDCGYPK